MSYQWRIQDFPEVGAPALEEGGNIQFCQILSKTAWNWKNLDPAVPEFYYVDPPLLMPWENSTSYNWNFRTHTKGTITVCPSMNIRNRHVGGASIFAKFHLWHHLAGFYWNSIDYVYAKQSICTISMLFNGTCLGMFSIDGAFPVW